MMRRRWRRAFGPIAPLCAVLLLLSLAPVASGGGPRCRTGPVGSAEVEVCIVTPSAGAVVSGIVEVEVTVGVSDGTPVDGVEAFLGGVQVLTDHESPYAFSIPSDRYADGSRALAVRALVGEDSDSLAPSEKTKIGLTFDNGNATEPGPTSGFDPPSASGAGVIAAATGDGADGGSRPQRVIDRIVSWDPDLFLYTGDVYDDGTREEFASWYGTGEQRWAALRNVTAPTVGNHEYQALNAQPYFDYWNGVPHYYAFDAGHWRVIVLDSMSSYGGHQPGSPQFEWLRDELAQSTAACTAISVHHPRFSVGKYSGSTWLQSIWSLAASSGVDVFLTGHDHNYQRWRPLGPTGAPRKDGMHQFIVGTGGHESYAIQGSDPRVATAITSDGAVRFELLRERARFAFIKPNGNTIDSGSFTCSPAPDRTPPSKPTGLGADLTNEDRVRLSWLPSTDDVGVTGYEVFRDGSLIATTPGGVTELTDGDVEPAETYGYRVRAFDAAGNRSDRSARAVVTIPVPPLFADDFSSGDLSSWSGSEGASVLPGVGPDGSAAMRLRGTASQRGYAFANLGSAENDVVVSAAMRLGDTDGSPIELVSLRQADGDGIVTLFLREDGTLALRDEETLAVTGSARILGPGWHSLSLRGRLGPEALSAVVLDGSPVNALSGDASFGDGPIERIRVGNGVLGRVFRLTVDDVVVTSGPA